MTKISFSTGEQTLAMVWQWYQQTDKAIDYYQKEVTNAMWSGASVSEIFWGMTEEEIVHYFSLHKDELDLVVSLNLIASAEASLRVDYLTRVYEKKKDVISRQFRELYKQKGSRVSLEEDILKTWKQFYPHCQSAIGEFMGILKLRHWLAHGRYWTPKFGRFHSPQFVFDIAESLFKKLPEDFSWAIGDDESLCITRRSKTNEY